MGVTLANVIETTDTRPLSKTARKQLFEEKRDIEALTRYYREDDTIKKAVAKHVASGAKLAMEGHQLPKGVAAFDILRGKSTVRTARDLAERIGFAIFPWPLVLSAFAPPGSVHNALLAWQDAGYSVRIMAPVQAYNLKAHIEHPDWQSPMFIPTDARQAFMALSMSIPVFRSLQEQINALRGQLRDYYDRVQSIERDVAQLRNRVNALGREVAESRAQRVPAPSRERVTTWYQSVTDPLALILPPKADLEDLDSPLLVGPAWGGDLPPEIAKLLARKSP